jgi:predicted ATPase
LKIKSLRASNFKSFKDLYVEFGKFNAIIGANAAGKSNLIQTIRFLRDIQNYGLENAVSLQGGVAYLRNANITTAQEISLEVVFQTDPAMEAARFYFRGAGPDMQFTVSEITYEIALRTTATGRSVRLSHEKMSYRVEFYNTVPDKVERNRSIVEKVKEVVIPFEKVKGRITPDLSQMEDLQMRNEFIYGSPRLGAKITLLERPPYFPGHSFRRRWFDSIAVYDFDPKLPKRGSPITAKAELEENGSNLSLVLSKIIEDSKKKNSISNLISDLLPFVKKLRIQRMPDNSMLFKLQERYLSSKYLPASLLSDGTINVTALVVALYFQPRPITIVEEPERNIHPQLIGKVVQMMKQAPEKQVIITTHNPEVVKSVDLGELLLIYRESDGSSRITRPADNQTVQRFIESGMSADRLFTKDLLGP